MEEQILKIIQENSHGVDVTFINGAQCVGSATDVEKISHEIAAHFTEFIEWKDDFTEFNPLNYKYEVELETHHLDEMTLNELYKHWLTNIKK